MATQTEKMEMEEGGENGERQNKRKDRTPEDREQARRKITKKVVIDTTTDDESVWEKATGQKDRRKISRKGTGSMTSTSERMQGDSEKARGKVTPRWSEVVKEGNKIRKEREFHPKVRKTEVIEIKTTVEKTYEEILREIKSKVKREEMKGVKTVRKTRAENLLIELEEGKEEKENPEIIKKLLQEKLGEEHRVVSLAQRRDFEIRDIDATVDKPELIEAIKEAIGDVKEEEIFIKTLRYSYNGTKIGVVVLEARWALEFAKLDKISVGFVKCKVVEVPRIARCFKCQKPGHLAYQCKEVEENRCRKCGSLGHDGRDCQEEARCFLCETEGMGRENPAQIRHVGGSYRCSFYIKEMRRVMEETSRKQNNI